jgi:hypothetical protein
MNKNTQIKDKEHINKGNTKATKDMSHFDIVQNKDHLLGDYCKYPMILLMSVMGILLQLIRQNYPSEVHK